MREKKLLSAIRKYLLAAAFCAVFGIIYELFSHEVYTPYMYLSCLIPLVGGTVPYLIIHMARAPLPAALSSVLYACGIATLTVGSIMQGVLVIYGTTNRLMPIYAIAGAVLLVVGGGSYLVMLIRRKARIRK